MILSTFSGLPKYSMFPDPFIFALMESLAKTSASPEPLIVIVADLDISSFDIISPDPLIFAISV